MANIDLSRYGITGAVEVIHNPSYEELYKAEVCCREDRLRETVLAIKAIHPYEEPVINAIQLIKI